MIIIGIFGLLILSAMALWMYCAVVQLENIRQELSWMRQAQERYNVRDRD